MNFATLNSMIDGLLTNKIPLFLLGEAGIGKTEFLKGKASELGTEIFTVHCNLLDEKSDLTGARIIQDPVTHEHVQRFFPMETINQCIDYAADNPLKPVLLFFDELNRTNTDVMSGCQTLITDRALGHRKLPENVVIVAAGNDVGAVNTMDSASVSRYTVIKINPDVNTFLEYNPTLHPAIEKVLDDHPNLLVCYPPENPDLMDEDKVLEQFTTPRTLSCLSKVLNSLSNPTLVSLQNTKDDKTNQSALNELIEGAIGGTEFAKYLEKEMAAYLRQNKNKKSAKAKFTKTKAYTDLIASTDMKDAEALIASYSDDEKMECLLGLLTEGGNAALTSALTSSISSVDYQSKNYISLVGLMTSKKYDESVFNAVLQCNNEISRVINNLNSAESF